MGKGKATKSRNADIVIAAFVEHLQRAPDNACDMQELAMLPAWMTCGHGCGKLKQFLEKSKSLFQVSRQGTLCFVQLTRPGPQLYASCQAPALYSPPLSDIPWPGYMVPDDTKKHGRNFCSDTEEPEIKTSTICAMPGAAKCKTMPAEPVQTISSSNVDDKSPPCLPDALHKAV